MNISISVKDTFVEVGDGQPDEVLAVTRELIELLALNPPAKETE